MKSWRVTKYDPSRRDPQGKYPGAEWTSVHDVGKWFGANVLTIEEYLRVESAYVDTIMDFYADAGLPILKVLEVELTGPIPNIPGQALSLTPVENAVARRGDLENVIRSCLREIFWCKLEAEDGSFMIHFGYDYYVYVSGVVPSSRTRAAAQSRGMFVESWQSPYTRTG